MKKRILYLIIPLLFAFLAGCGSGGTGELKKEGFTEIQSYKDQDIRVTVFTGMASYSKTVDVFTQWAENNGWEEKDGSFEYFSGYSGKLFGKKGEIMLISIMDTGGAVTVTTMVASDDMDSGGRDSATTTTSPAKAEFENFEKISEISKYFSEMSISFDYGSSASDSETIEYSFMGETDLEGRKAVRLKVQYQGNTVEIWVDEENDVVLKAVMNDQEIPEDQRQQGAMFIDYLGLFFKGQNWDQGITDADKKNASRDLGAGKMDVIQYEYEINVAGQKMVLQSEIAEVDGRHILIKYLQTGGDGEVTGGWSIIRLIKR